MEKGQKALEIIRKREEGKENVNKQAERMRERQRERERERIVPPTLTGS